MAEIRVLPTHLVNKIAAGEVVERPASVVKELIENAIDAGATRIDVSVEDGGRKLIAVTDDGCGMSAEDLALALASHATSKLTSVDDLLGISTMGFRGEALASVGSISHAHIRTRRRDDDGGCEVSASGDTIEAVRPCAAAPGTTVTVRDLFFNTPARRKFLRTVNTEMGHVTERLIRLAIPHPTVAFTLRHNGREVQNLPAVETTGARIRDLFGDKLSEGLLPIAPRGREVGVAGLIGRPEAARGSGKWEYFFLNGRYIRDRLIAHALREAYRGLIDPGQFPVAFIFIEMDPEEVDVNVHPTKIEVRFRNGQLVHGELLAALKDTLNKANLVPRASLGTEASGRTVSADASESDPAGEQRRDSLRQALADFFKATPPTQPRFSFPERPARTHHGEPPERARSARDDDRPRVPQAPPSRFTAPVGEPAPAGARLEPPSPSPSPPPAIQIHDSYIVTACEDGLVIIDQHALHERVLYNELKERLTGPEGTGAGGRLTAQRMLIPETIEVTAAETSLLESNVELLSRLGIEVAAFGPTTVAVQQFPSILAEHGVPPGRFIRETIDKLSEDATTDPERVLEDLLEMMACRAAVKAGDALSPEEIESLLRGSETTEKASSCPHGRPTTLKLTLRELEKQFKRT